MTNEFCGAIRTIVFQCFYHGKVEVNEIPVLFADIIANDDKWAARLIRDCVD